MGGGRGALTTGGVLSWHSGLGGERIFGGGCLLQHGYLLFWGNMLAYHCYRIKPILFCANTILFTEKGPWHFSIKCRTYLNAEVIDRQCVYRNNFHLQNNSASHKFFVMYSPWETFSGVQYSNVWTKWWTYKYWWATESHLCHFVLGCCGFFFYRFQFLSSY